MKLKSFLITLLISVTFCTLTHAQPITAQNETALKDSVKTITAQALSDIQNGTISQTSPYVAVQTTEEAIKAFINSLLTVQGFLPGSRITTEHIAQWTIRDIIFTPEKDIATVILDLNLTSGDKGYPAHKTLFFQSVSDSWQLLLKDYSKL